MSRLKLGALLPLLLSTCLHPISAMVSSGRRGHGLIGYGITMHQPLCAYACRDVLSGSTLSCTPPMDDMEGGHIGHGESMTPPDCFASDTAFLQSLAWCLSTRCLGVSTWDLERYWSMNVAGNDEVQPAPAESYQMALMHIARVPTRVLEAGGDLNETMVVPEEDWQESYNGQGSFERNEAMHATIGIALLVSCSAIPIAISLLRFIPFPRLLASKFNAYIIDPPLLGDRHRVPIAGLFHVPTRGQSLFIAYLVAINIVLSSAGYTAIQPNSYFASANGIAGEIMTYIGNRTGVLAFANIPLLILFAGRNNFLLWVTNWSHGTFLLAHRWVALLATLLAVIHSLVYWAQYVDSDAHAEESRLSYWIWGIVATLAMCILLSASILPIRKHAYEIFLATHVLFAVFAVAGCYWHILDRFGLQWGYENWMYAAIAVWGFDRVFRAARLLRNGVKTAMVTVVDEGYVRVDIEGVRSTGGHAYLYFPTLSWRVWENHPFSVMGAMLRTPGTPSPTSVAETDAIAVESGPAEKRTGQGERDFETGSIHLAPKHNSRAQTRDVEKRASSSSSAASATCCQPPSHPTATSGSAGLSFLLRTRTGLTARLRRWTAFPLPVLVESGYAPPHTFPPDTKLVCIVGGVGITACVPYLRAHAGESKLYWGVSIAAIVGAVEGFLGSTGSAGRIFVGERGERMDVSAVVRGEVEGEKSEDGEVVVLVSGPEGMADEVRGVVAELGREGARGGRVRLVEEMYSW